MGEKQIEPACWFLKTGRGKGSESTAPLRMCELEGVRGVRACARRTYRSDEVDDEEGVECGDDGGGDGCDDAPQALEPPEEPQDSEGPQHLEPWWLNQGGLIRWPAGLCSPQGIARESWVAESCYCLSKGGVKRGGDFMARLKLILPQRLDYGHAASVLVTRSHPQHYDSLWRPAVRRGYL
jgi:hypothetical protein